jgi:uncharacterized protein
VLHTATARIFLVDLDTAARLAGETTPTGSDTADQQFHDLGLLVAADADEAGEVVAASRTAAATSRRREFVVMPSAYCNMGCGYCGQSHERTVTATAHRTILAERVAAAAAGGRHDSINVRWVGGEPMMGYAVIRDLSRRFIDAADRAAVAYTALIVTNGTLLDLRKLRALHHECRIGRVEVTLDGPADLHDTTRPLKNGAGSFDRITAVLRSALDAPDLAGLQISIRTNVGVGNAHLADETAAAFAAAGLAHPQVQCYPAPVHSWGNDVSDTALARQDMATAELSWLAAYLRHGLRTALLPATPRAVVCAAVTRHSEVLAPDGRVYSCTEQPLVPGHDDRHVTRLATLPVVALRPAGLFDDWYDAVDAGETGCRGCAILPLCGGSCPKLWREGAVPCPPLKLNVRERLDLYARSVGCLPVGDAGSHETAAPATARPAAAGSGAHLPTRSA